MAEPVALAVHAERLFDGDRWHEDVSVLGEDLIEEVVPGAVPGAVSVPLVVPGLIDCGARPEGYVDGPATGRLVRAPEEAFVSLCAAYGVTSVVDIGSSLATSWWFHREAGVNYLAGGPRVCRRPASRTDIAVADHDDTARAVECLMSAGAVFVSCEQDAASSVGSVGSVDGAVPRVVTRDRDGTTLPGLSVERTGGTWRAPQLLASRLWSVDGLVAQGDRTEARAFLPYLGHFRGGDDFMARRAARRALTRVYGSRPALDQGDESPAPTSSAPSAHRDPPGGSRILASSGAGSPGTVPGRSLWEEMELLEEAHGLDAALRSTSGNASRAFPELNAGRLAPGLRFDALLCQDQAQTVSQVQHAVHSSVLAGRLRAVEDAHADVHRQVQEADRRTI